MHALQTMNPRVTKRMFPLFSLIGCMFASIAACWAEGRWEATLKEGDIVFSGNRAGQGAAIIAATGSAFTHCGVVFFQNGRLMVIEAVQPVRVVPLAVFMGADASAVFTARRPRKPLDQAGVQRARAWATRQVDKAYDTRFAWSDDRMYCSELVWKLYREAGIELCKPRKLRDFNLRHPEVVKLINERYGGMGRAPLDEPMVAPSDLAASTELEAVPPPP